MTGGDPALLEQVLDQEGIQGSPAEPSRLAWVVDRVSAFLEGAFDAVQGVPGMGELVWIVAAVIAAVLGVLTLLAIVRLARVWRARPRAQDPGQAPILASLDPIDARRHRAEAEAALAAGRPRDAVRAAWAWVAWTLHERAIARYEPDLTNREFVEVVRRTTPGWPPLAGLRSFARTADTLCYGVSEPAPDEARALLGLAERMLQGAR